MELLRIRSTDQSMFTDLMSLFARFMNKELQTKVNDIAYWINQSELVVDHYFHSIAIVEPDGIIGYFQLAYIKENNVVIIDNMMIIPKYRTFRMFHHACIRLNEYIETHLPECRYVITEMAQPNCRVNKSDEPEKLTNLLLRKGFSALPVVYVSVSDPCEHSDADINATLLIKPVRSDLMLSRNQIVELLDSVYFGHYLRWYSHSCHSLDAYKRRLDTAFALSVASIEKIASKL